MSKRKQPIKLPQQLAANKSENFNESNKEYDPAIEANSIARKVFNWNKVATIVNFLLFLLTLVIIYVSWEAMKVTKDSLEDNRRIDSRNREWDEAINTPYIQAENFIIDSMIIGKPMTIFFEIKNLKDIPVKMYWHAFRSDFQYFLPSVNSLQDSMKNPPENVRNYDNTIIIKDQPYRTFASTNTVLTKDKIHEFKEGKVQFLLYGNFAYQNLINNKKRYYYFLMQFGYAYGRRKIKVFVEEFVYNENVNQ